MSEKVNKNKTKKRKNSNNINISGESESKVHVSTSQSEIPRIHNGNGNMEPHLINNVCNPGFNPGFVNQSTPAPQNQFVPYSPQAPQGQFAGFVSPIQKLPNVDIRESLKNMCDKLEQMSLKLSKLDTIDNRLSDLERNMRSVNTDVQEMKTKVRDMDNSMTFMNSHYEEQKCEIKVIKESMANFNDQSNQIMNNNSEILDTVRTLNGELKELKERHIDLQTRSMRDNLIFDGIQEQTEEDTEEVLKTFIQKEMNISDDLPFHRVHRMGKRIPGKHRPIVAKFVLFKDREKVRRAAPSTLRNKPYGVNEQFPREIHERRKQLYPHFKTAKQQGKRASMVADKSFVDGRQVHVQFTEPKAPETRRHDPNAAQPRAREQKSRNATAQR